MAVLNNLPQFIALSKNVGDDFVFINDYGKKLFSISDNQIVNAKHLCKEAFSEAEISEIANTIKKQGNWVGDKLFTDKKGNDFWGQVKIESVTVDKSKYFICTILNEDESVKASLKQKRDQQRLEVLFQNSTIGILVVDQVGVITLINSFAEKQFGYNAGEVLGKKIEILIPHHLSAKHTHHREDFLKKPQSRPMGIGLDLKGLKKDGTQFPVEISLSRFDSDGGYSVVAFINDITLRKQHEEDLLRQKSELEKSSAAIKELNTQLERKVEERTLVLRETLAHLEMSKEEISDALKKEKELGDLKSRFVSMASHEFRTPLATVLSSASLIAKYVATEDHEKRMKHVVRIQDNVRNLTDILEDFLSLGKIEEGLIHVKTDVIDLPAFIKNICNDLKEVNHLTQQLKVNHKGQMEFATDQHLLKNILINLLTNAIKFSAADGVIEIRSSISKSGATIEIKDFGIGISNDDQKHLFDRFFRGRNALNIKGTGLGLHIVSKYVSLLSGKISFSSVLNEGTTFKINLPHPTKSKNQ